MKKTELKRFRGILDEKRESVIQRAKDTMAHDMTLDPSEMPDEMDLASTEYMQVVHFSPRAAESASFLQKIEKAIKKIDEGEFGICEDCEEPIGLKRIEGPTRDRTLYSL